ncbi:MAG: toxin [Pseudomonadota bacterium]|nr:toxin [Pseudomonadota bacterium]
MGAVLAEVVFEWSDEKNQLLKVERNVSFEDVVLGLNNGKLLDIVSNSSAEHKGQYCLIIDIGNYAHIVPFVKNETTFFLKTIYPSRKQTKKYLQKR